MQKKVIVLGGGMVGSTIAMDLSKQFKVTVADIEPKTLSKLQRVFGIECHQADVTDRKKLEQLIQDYDLVIGAIPGKIGFEVVKRVIDAGKNMVDISLFQEDPFELHERAKQKGVSIAIDCGIAPGISNMIVGYHNTGMKISKYTCMVGGLPRERNWPWEYKAVFSPSDVIEEYIRPARYFENGQVVTKEAFSDPELIQFENIGTLEAWNSDGLRTLLKTTDVPNMVEKTLRYPGTIEYLRVLRESGFFSDIPLDINGVKIKPLDLTTKLLLPQWELKKGDEDFTILKAQVIGMSDKEPMAFEYNLYDKYDNKTGIHSMARTTGYSCAAVAEIFLTDGFKKHGIIPPELIAGQKGLFSRIVNYLENRGVVIKLERLY